MICHRFNADMLWRYNADVCGTIPPHPLPSLALALALRPRLSLAGARSQVIKICLSTISTL